DSSKHIRQAAAEALKYYNPKIVFPVLLTHLKSDTNKHVQLALIESITVVGDSSAVTSLLPFLKNDDSVIRQLTVRAIAVLGDNRIIPYIEAASHDENKFVRDEAN